MSIHFGGLYLKSISEQVIGVGTSKTSVTISVTNDTNGNHADRYASIIGDTNPEESPQPLDGEKIFNCGFSDSGYDQTSYFRAGRTKIAPNDATKKPLIVQLINELKELRPPTKQYLLQKVEQYFR